MPAGAVTALDALYHRGHILGRGASGVAFTVRPKKQSGAGEPSVQYVAKEIWVGRFDEKRRREAVTESKLLQDINHRHIVACLDAFLDVDVLYIIMEYASGGDLGKRIQAQKNVQRFPEPDVMSAFVQICAAMHHIHSRKILHRDLKPANLFVAGDGDLGCCTVKLGDFGIAKMLEGTQGQANSTVGTPSYISPEICKNSPYGMKSDVWSLGVILYEIACLRVPFQATNLPAMALMICTSEPKPIPEEFSEGLQELVRALLQKDHTKRPRVGDVLHSTPYVQQFLCDELVRTIGMDVVKQTQQLAKPDAHPAQARGASMPKRSSSATDIGSARLPSCGPSVRQRLDKFLLQEDASQWCWHRPLEKIPGETLTMSMSASDLPMPREKARSGTTPRQELIMPARRPERAERAAERAERGERGGPRAERVDHSDSDSGPAGPSGPRDRGERSRGDRPQRGERANRTDRLDGQRVERTNREERQERQDRARRSERGATERGAERADRNVPERPPPDRAGERPSDRLERRAERLERERGDRVERGDRPEAADTRPERRCSRGEDKGDKPDRLSRGDRAAREEQSSRCDSGTVEGFLETSGIGHASADSWAVETGPRASPPERVEALSSSSAQRSPELSHSHGPWPQLDVVRTLDMTVESVATPDQSGLADTTDEEAAVASEAAQHRVQPPAELVEPAPPPCPAEPPNPDLALSGVATGMYAAPSGGGTQRRRRDQRCRGRPPIGRVGGSDLDLDVRSPVRPPRRKAEEAASPADSLHSHQGCSMLGTRSVSPNRCGEPTYSDLPLMSCLRSSGSTPALPPLPPMDHTLRGPSGSTLRPPARSRSVASISDGRTEAASSLRAGPFFRNAPVNLTADSGAALPQERAREPASGSGASAGSGSSMAPRGASSGTGPSSAVRGPSSGAAAPLPSAAPQQQPPPQRQAPRDEADRSKLALKLPTAIAGKDDRQKLPAGGCRPPGAEAVGRIDPSAAVREGWGDVDPRMPSPRLQSVR